MNATEYLRYRSIIQKNNTDLYIKFDDKSEVSLIEIMDSYHEYRLELKETLINKKDISKDFNHSQSEITISIQEYEALKRDSDNLNKVDFGN